MSFFVSSGSDSRLDSSLAIHTLEASGHKGCAMTGCECDANWQKFKKDPTYDHYMRAHRVKVGKMEAVSPPGFGGTVKHMAKDHKGISNPHALAWYMYEKGDKSHEKAPKGTGAKTVSKDVAKKRSKALSAGGPGSGRHKELTEKYSERARDHTLAARYHADRLRQIEKAKDSLSRENQAHAKAHRDAAMAHNHAHDVITGYEKLTRQKHFSNEDEDNHAQAMHDAITSAVQRSKTANKMDSASMSAGGPGSGRHPGEGAKTKAEHEAAAKYHAAQAEKFVGHTNNQSAMDVAMAHYSAETAHKNAAKLGTDRHSQWAREASGRANAEEENFGKSSSKKLVARKA